MRNTITRRTHSSGALSFTSLTNWARPAFTPTRTVNFSTKAGLDSAISGMQAGDLIQYNGTGVLTISSSSSTAYTIASKNPSSTVVIDFGTRATSQITAWGATTSANYVKFAYTGTSQFDALYLHDISNLRIYGGEYTTGNYGGDGIYILTASNIYVWDAYVNVVGTNGVHIAPITTSGASSTITNANVRAEVNQFCMNPSWDAHVDKGTGFHGMMLHPGGTLTNSTFTVYAHDPLLPGASSAGKTWPEGGGGCALEIGMNTGNSSSNTHYCLGVNLLMRPNGTNPGSTGTQQGGNVIDVWGGAPLDGCIVGWVEGRNCTGAVVGCSSGGWTSSNPPLTVNHGRHSNVNQYPLYNQITVPYDKRYTIHYNDCT